MSAEGNQGTNILLPSARIAVFSMDGETISSAETLLDDWRFARVEVKAIKGDVEAAISAYQEESSPDLLIIQTEDINDAFTERLGELSGYCDEGTAAIIVGPVNDVYLYRKLIDMGISDYLVKPIKPEIISEVIAKALITRLGVSDSALIAFIGAKGGVGVSALAQLSSCLASKKMGQKCILVDGGGGWASSSVGLGYDPAATFPEVARAVSAGNEDTLKRMIQVVNEKLSVLATGSDAMLDPSISAEQAESILDNLMVKFPVVLVDLSSSPTSVRKAVLGRASRVVVVSTPTVTSLRFCRSLLKEISDIRGGKTDVVSLVLNKCGLSKGHEVSKADVENAIEFKVSSTIDNIPQVFLKHESNIAGIAADKDGGVVVTAILPILGEAITSADVDGEPSDKNSGILGGFLNKITAK
ncbi:MAG: AAA family ATPase [Alphaproteobacteria bacterium]